MLTKLELKHQDNMSVCFIPPYTPLLYSKTGVYRGMHYFLIFALKHRLWVLVRTHNICFEQKYENCQNISSENCHFYSRKKSLYVAWACFRNEAVQPVHQPSLTRVFTVCMKKDLVQNYP